MDCHTLICDHSGTTSGKEQPNSLPHVFHTQDADWDPKVLDLEQSENPEWYGNADDPPLLNPDFDIQGDYRAASHCLQNGSS